MATADVSHQLGITEPTVSRDDRRGQMQAALAQSQQARIDHLASPTQLVPARPARPNRVGAPHGKVHRHHPLAIANDHHHLEAINA